MSLVIELTIINSLLMYSMTTLFSLTRYLMARYFILMCLLRLPLVLFFVIKTATELSQRILNDLDIESMIISLIIKLFNHTPYDVASKHKTDSASIVEVAIKVSFT